MNKRVASFIANIHRAARALDSNLLFREAEALDYVLMRLANKDDMRDAGGLYGAVMDMNNIQNTGLGKGIATARPGQGYYGNGVSAPLQGPKITSGMTAEQIANAKFQWAQDQAQWLGTESQVSDQQYGAYDQQFDPELGQQIQNYGKPGANGQFEVSSNLPMPTTYVVPPAQS